MDAIRILKTTLPAIHEKLRLALEAEDDFQMVIQKHDSSLKARQRDLCHVWYATIANFMHESKGHAEAYCKYNYGFKIRCEDDERLRDIIRRMIEPYHRYEDRLVIIEDYSEFFAILRDQGGMTSEQIGRYLLDIQQGFAKEGLFLTSINDEELFKCREATT